MRLPGASKDRLALKYDADSGRVTELTIPDAMAFMEWKTPNGCASCRPALNYYLISTWPHEAADDPQSRFRYLTHLLAKELVLRNFGRPGDAETLERMVEILTYLEPRGRR